MLKLFYSLVLSAALGLAGGVASAQLLNPGSAQAEAQSRLACGSGTVLNATYLPGGLLRVTCQSSSTQSSTASTASELPAALQGTGVVAGPVAGAIAVVVLGAIMLGDDSSGTSSSSSSAAPVESGE